MQRARNQETTEGIRKLSEELARLGWYHSIELPDGRVIPGLQSIDVLRKRIAEYPIPQDLRGKRVLDIGAWDGWFSFEMERRGASVVAVDSSHQDTLLEAKRLLNSKVEYVIGDICRLTPRDLGYFDIVLFFGVLYHVKHPLLAMERVCELTTDLLCLESLVTDDPPTDAIPLMEFYEGTELAGQFDNWVGPNTSCLLAFCRTAGFVDVELKSVEDYRARVVCRRKWPEVERSGNGPELVCVENTWTRDHSFSAARDDYFTSWFVSPESDLNCHNVFLQVGPYAVRPAGVQTIGGNGWQTNAKLPLGLNPGWHDVSMAIGSGQFSNRLRIPVDLPRNDRRSSGNSLSKTIRIAGVADGKTFEPKRVRTGPDSCVSVWVSGLPDAAKTDISLRLDGADLPAVFLSGEDSDGYKQINAMLPPKLAPGEYLIAVNVGGVESSEVPVELYKS